MLKQKQGVSLPCSRLRRKAAALDCIKWALGTSGAARFARLTQPVPAGRLWLLSKDLLTCVFTQVLIEGILTFYYHSIEATQAVNGKIFGDFS